MSIKRYVANKDTTITNAFMPNMVDRAVNSNMGASDSLEIFSIYGQTYTSSLEQSRILVQFPTEDILNDRTISKIPGSGSVKFFLRMFNVEHPFSLPKDYKIHVSALSQSWDEGYGLDMETYYDYGWSQIKNGHGATWNYATSASVWIDSGGDFYGLQQQYNFDYQIKEGTEDIEIDVTNVVENWLNSTISNYGFIIKLSGSYEDGTKKQSFYTKKFSARGSEFFYKRPIIEARWEAINTDDRGNFFASSSMLSEEDNKMSIYFYNKVNGRNKNIVGDILPNVKFYTDEQLTNEITSSYKMVSNPIAGVYKAQVSIDTTASILYDVWYNTSSLQQYFSSEFEVNSRFGSDTDSEEDYVISIQNNKLTYSDNEIARFKIFSRKKNWQPTKTHSMIHT